MADFLINSLRGGQNEVAPISLGDDQCVVARNVEFYKSMLGERRKGAAAIDLTGSAIANCDRVTFLYRHLPTTNPADAQLWALGITGSTPTLVYKDTTWHTVTMADALTVDGVSEYQVAAQTLHGKLFLAYNSGVDRLHVWDGTSLRRTGLAEPAQPSAANSGSGSFSGARYYRVRYTVRSGSTTLRRSEPSTVLATTPSGTGSGITVTKPATISEGETHWELEASLDNANFYILATTAVGTTTATDTQDFNAGYATDFELSEDIGDYELIPSVRYLTAEQDRLMTGGSFENVEFASRVSWTPVYNDPGVGNDERIPVDTDNFIDLDGFEGGSLTGLSATVNGYVYATKMLHTYQLSRSGVRTRAYEAVPLTKQRGALPGSLVEGLGATGNPTLFMLDGDVGPCHLSSRGVEQCGADLVETWETINLDATKVVSRGVYFPEKQQVHWWVATGAADVPNLHLVLHTKEVRATDDGARRGWAVWDGPSAAALAVCMFANNIDDDTARSNVLKPFIAVEGNGLVWRTDTGDDDNGTAYAARIVTKPYVHGNLLHQFECKSGTLLARADTGATLDVTVLADFGLVEADSPGISLTPTAGEDRVMKVLDDLSLAELRVVQVEFADPATPGTAQWSLEQFALRESTGQRAS